MTRVQADLALGLAGLIWGFGFVAQKDALDHIGPFTFVAARFLVSALVVLPLVFYEKGLGKLRSIFFRDKNANKIFVLCGAFSLAVLVQQYGLTATTVTHAAFFTGLYVVLVPFVGKLFYGQKLSLPVFIASLLSVAGVWLLSGGNTDDLRIDFGRGDTLILLCAFCFALQVSVMGHLAGNMKTPFTLSFLQYLGVGMAALILAFCLETIEWNGLVKAWLPILFAGIASGGIAYTLQAVAQQHTPPADTAIILSTEALFGGIGGVWLLHDKITFGGILGCCAILAGIALVEIGPLWRNARRRSS